MKSEPKYWGVTPSLPPLRWGNGVKTNLLNKFSLHFIKFYDNFCFEFNKKTFFLSTFFVFIFQFFFNIYILFYFLFFWRYKHISKDPPWHAPVLYAQNLSYHHSTFSSKTQVLAGKKSLDIGPSDESENSLDFWWMSVWPMGSQGPNHVIGGGNMGTNQKQHRGEMGGKEPEGIGILGWLYFSSTKLFDKTWLGLINRTRFLFVLFFYWSEPYCYHQPTIYPSKHHLKVELYSESI